MEDEYEVICIDDCSTDDTLLHLYELQKLHNNMQVLRNCENLRAGGGTKSWSKKTVVANIFYLLMLMIIFIPVDFDKLLITLKAEY